MSIPTIPGTITEAKLTQFRAKLDELRALLPTAVPLSPAENAHLSKIGNARLPAVQALSEAAPTHPEIVAPGIDAGELARYVGLMASYEAALAETDAFRSEVAANHMVCKAQASAMFNPCYDQLKNVAKRMPGLQPLLDKISGYFKRGPRNGKPSGGSVTGQP